MTWKRTYIHIFVYIYNHIDPFSACRIRFLGINNSKVSTGAHCKRIKSRKKDDAAVSRCKERCYADKEISPERLQMGQWLNRNSCTQNQIASIVLCVDQGRKDQDCEARHR